MKHLVDPVLGLLLAQICCVRGVDVEQSPPALSLQEGDSSTFWCNFPTTLVSNVQWYRQKSGGHLDHLFFIPSGTKQNGRLNATTVAKERRSSLYISSAEITDSATYLCAGVSAQKLVFGRGTTLKVNLNIKNPDPAVYQLKGPKSNNISVCLYTDFQMNTTKDSEPAVFSLSRTVFNSNTTVLDMGALGSKSNGLVAWSKSTDFECQSTFQQEFYPNSGISCDAKLVEKSFETDMNLNQNLSVMGFRIILLKMVGFNLLMTLRLWSS
uniref:uncharacterized LOC102166266 precursor n=1 Tax=Sus scrofa TaxID=9823 RepID=UPI00001B6047|nr:uncharacterized LOC102166266 precursor [Sus scrofa]BAC66606.1 T cell receptor alpha chain [Sus scrofa]